jgi:hypothetical protein
MMSVRTMEDAYQFAFEGRGQAGQKIEPVRKR